MSGKRMFEYVEGSSSKFWEVWADGGSVFTRFGKIGSAGQTKVKDEGDAASAKATLAKLVKEKTGKGYVELNGKKAAVVEDEDDEDDEDDDADDEAEAGEDEDEDNVEAPAGVRRFEQSTKFWEIEVEGPSHTVRFGKLGTTGQAKTKNFVYSAAALSDYARLVAEKTSEGYAEVDPDAAKAPKLDAKQLKQHLKNLPPLVDDPAYLVFADWLQTQDHPWGELIVLQHGAATNGKKATNAKKAASLQQEADKLLAVNGGAILGRLARAKYSHWEWHLGFLRRVVVGTSADAASIAKSVKAVLALPAAHMLEALVINPVVERFPVWRSWDSSLEHVVDPWEDLEKLASTIPQRITQVGFGGWPAPGASAYVQMPSFSKLSKHFPGLTRLELTGTLGDKPGKLSLGQLVDLEVRFANAGGQELEAIASAKLPKLRRLAVWLGGSSNVTIDDVYPPDEWEEGKRGLERYPDTFSAADLERMEDYGIESYLGATDLTTFLQTNFSPSLTHLGLKSGCLTPELCSVIARSPIIKRIRTLDLSGGQLDDTGAAALIAAKKALAHLASIDVSRNRLTAAGAKKLVAALPNAVTGTIDSKHVAPDFYFRYVATVE
jgi:uncharacterized protein (TIGR02996 family)